MSAAPVNPYVGPRALRAGEALFGRDREVARLFDLMLAERIVLLYSPSGAGKSSLLQAGLVPRLHAEGFTVRPVVRVGMAPPTDAPAGVNRYVLSTLLSLEEDVPKDRQQDLAALARCTLAQYLARRPEADADEVLLLDQFEELLTVDATAVAEKRMFFAQLGEALRDTRLWVVVAMREDFIAGLDPYRAAVPKKLSTTFRLDLLGREAALLAVRGPAAAAGVCFEVEAAERLVDDLRQVRVPQVDGGVSLRPGPHVEPVQLQVVCRGLWAALPEDDRTIGLDDLAQLGDVDQALARYYDAQVELAARASGTPERALRLWIERELVTAQGLRTQVLRTPGATQGLADAALTALVDALLLRTDTRRGMMWVELAHDRIVAPLLASNAAWMTKNLAPASRQAALWDSRGRPESLLLATEAEARTLLTAAGEWTATEQAFLEQSQIVRRREAATRRNQRTIRVLAVIVAVLVVAGLSLGIVLIRRAAAAALEKAEQEAHASAEAAARALAEQRAAEQALIRQLIAQVALYREQQPELAALLAVAASTRLADPWQRKAALLNAAVASPQLTARLSPGPGADGAAPAYVQIAGAGGQLYALDRRGQVQRLGLADRSQTPLLPAGTRAGDFAVDPVRGRMAIVAGQAIELWDLGDATPAATIVLPEDRPGLGDAPRPDARVWLEGLSFSADGRTLAAVRRSDGPARGFVIDVETRSVRPLAGKLPVPALALAPDGSLAVAGPLEIDGSIVVFSGPKLARSVLSPAHAGAGRVYLARFDPHRPRLLTAGEGAAATLWTVEHGTLSAPRPLPLGGGGNVRDALFLADGKLVIAMETRISVWSGEPLAPWGTPITPPTRATATLAAVGADGLQVAALSLADAPIHVFDPRRMAPWQLATPRAPMTEGGDTRFEGVAPRVAIDRAGGRVAATSFDRQAGARVTVLDLASGASVATAAAQVEQFMALAFADTDQVVSIDGAGSVLAWTLPGGAAKTLWKLPQRPQRVALGVDPAGLAVAASVAREATSVTLTAQDPAAAESSPRTSTIAIGAPITALALDHAAGRIAVATCSERIGLATCRRGEVRVFAVAGGAQVAGPLAIDAGVRGLVFAADGRRLAGLVPGAPPAVWQLADGERLALTVRRSLGEFIAADFSADGAVLLASAEADNAAVALTLWDLRSGEELAPPLVAHNPAVGSFDPNATRSVLLAPHSGLVVSSSFDGVLLWDIADEALTGRACALARRELTPAEWTRFLGNGEPQQALCDGR